MVGPPNTGGIVIVIVIIIIVIIVLIIVHATIPVAIGTVATASITNLCVHNPLLL